MQESILKDNVGTRWIREMLVAGGLYTLKCEFSLPSLLLGENSACLHDLMCCHSRAEKKIAKRLELRAKIPINPQHGAFMPFKRTDLSKHFPPN
jgi:hypothetical protein